MTMANYSDTRQEFWRSQFEAAKALGPYLAEGPAKHRSKWEAMAEHIALGDEQRQRAATFVRNMPVLCLSGIWCGDCVRQGPILEAIAAASSGVDLRFVERAEDQLAEELRINGALKVPVVVLLSEDFYEVARIGDRMLSTYRKKAQRELGPTCEVGLVPPAAEELAVEIDEWLDEFERAQWILRLSPLLRQRHGD
jgi:hypothetical protein